MKRIIPLMLGSVLLLGATACSESADTAAPDNGVRSDQRESDVRARDQRDGMNPVTEGGQRTSEDLAVDVRNSLESSLPGSRLAVDIDDSNGMATIDGTVLDQAQFDEIESRVMAFEGINSVDIRAEIDSN